MRGDGNMDNTLYFIAARGQSSRFPRKHFAEVNGRPLLWYTLDWAKRQGIARQTILVTDDNDYAAYATTEGIGAIVTPSALGGNTWKAIGDAVRIDGRKTTKIAHLNPCAPLRPPGLLEEAHRRLTANWDGVISCVRQPTWRHYCYPGPLGVRLDRPCDMWQSSGCLTMIRADRLYPLPSAERELEMRLALRCLEHAGPVADVDVPEDIAPLEGIIRRGYGPWTAAER